MIHRAKIHPRARLLAAMAASLCAVAWGLPVQAASPMPPDAPGAGNAERRPPPPRPPGAAELQRDLGITAAQAKAVADALAVHHAQMRQLEQGARDQRQALRARTDAQLKTTLGEAGFQRFQAWRAEHRPPRGRPPGGQEGRQDGRPGAGAREGRRPPPPPGEG